MYQQASTKSKFMPNKINTKQQLNQFNSPESPTQPPPPSSPSAESTPKKQKSIWPEAAGEKVSFVR